MSLSGRSRLALLIAEVYFILMSHGSLTEREERERLESALTPVA
jgi:predicted metal-dependent peptidase